MQQDTSFTPSACPQAGYGSPRSSRRRYLFPLLFFSLKMLTKLKTKLFLGNRKCEPRPCLMFLKKTQSRQSPNKPPIFLWVLSFAFIKVHFKHHLINSDPKRPYWTIIFAHLLQNKAKAAHKCLKYATRAAKIL